MCRRSKMLLLTDAGRSTELRLPEAARAAITAASPFRHQAASGASREPSGSRPLTAPLKKRAIHEAVEGSFGRKKAALEGPASAPEYGHLRKRVSSGKWVEPAAIRGPGETNGTKS